MIEGGREQGGKRDWEENGTGTNVRLLVTNAIKEITSLPFAYDAAGNMTEQGLPAATTKYYTHDAWNRLTEVRIGTTTYGEYEYNALHWRDVKRARVSPSATGPDEMRLMYYSANWQLLEERIDRSWTSGFTEDERAQTFWGKRYIDDGAWASRPRSSASRDRDANGEITFEAPVPPGWAGRRVLFQAALQGECPAACGSNVVAEVIR